MRSYYLKANLSASLTRRGRFLLPLIQHPIYSRGDFIFAPCVNVTEATQRNEAYFRDIIFLSFFFVFIYYYFYYNFIPTGNNYLQISIYRYNLQLFLQVTSWNNFHKK